jgi:hypothetical protein
VLRKKIAELCFQRGIKLRGVEIVVYFAENLLHFGNRRTKRGPQTRTKAVDEHLRRVPQSLAHDTHLVKVLKVVAITHGCPLQFIE